MVALQVRAVPDEVRAALIAEADRQGRSLQSYLLEVLAREAGAARNRSLTIDWMRQPLVDVEIDSVALIHQLRDERDRQLSDLLD